MPARGAAMNRHKARAKTFEAGEVLVAARLIDPPLAAELGLDRRNRDAARLFRAVAAALAHGLVDEDALWRVRKAAALAAPALLGRAGLIVDEDGETGRCAQLPLHAIQPVAVMDLDAFGKVRARAVPGGLVGDDDHASCTLGQDLARDRRHG